MHVPVYQVGRIRRDRLAQLEEGQADDSVSYERQSSARVSTDRHERRAAAGSPGICTTDRTSDPLCF